MGDGYRAVCGNCGYESQTLCCGFGMSYPDWVFQTHVIFLCKECREFISIAVFCSEKFIKRYIEKEKKGKIKHDYITNCMYKEKTKEIIRRLKRFIPYSRKQHKTGIICPKCKSKKLREINVRSHTDGDKGKRFSGPIVCPKCHKKKLLFKHILDWD